MDPHYPYTEPSACRIDYDRIADTGDVEMYRRAWTENPGERETLEDIFPDLHDAVFNNDEED